VHGESLQKVISGLPSMKKPTISTLFGGEDYAVRSVIPRKSLVSYLSLQPAPSLLSQFVIWLLHRSISSLGLRPMADQT